jgi:hypothetical protein
MDLEMKDFQEVKNIDYSEVHESIYEEPLQPKDDLQDIYE